MRSSSVTDAARLARISGCSAASGADSVSSLLLAAPRRDTGILRLEEQQAHFKDILRYPYSGERPDTSTRQHYEIIAQQPILLRNQRLSDGFT
jgi:hypothetical protein